MRKHSEISVDQILDIIFQPEDPLRRRNDQDIPLLTAEAARRFNTMPTARTFGCVIKDFQELQFNNHQIATVLECVTRAVRETIETKWELNPAGTRLTLDDVPYKASKPLGCSYGTYNASDGTQKGHPIPAHLYPEIYRRVHSNLERIKFEHPRTFSVVNKRSENPAFPASTDSGPQAGTFFKTLFRFSRT
jgi:hypothetical protein